EVADPIDDLDGVGPAERQVTAVDDHVGTDLVEVGEHGVESGQVAVDIGDDRDPHRRYATGRSRTDRLVWLVGGQVLLPLCPRQGGLAQADAVDHPGDVGVPF